MARDRVTIGTVVKLALASLAVGLELAWLEVTPNDLVDRISGVARSLCANQRDFLQPDQVRLCLGDLCGLGGCGADRHSHAGFDLVRRHYGHQNHPHVRGTVRVVV